MALTLGQLIIQLKAETTAFSKGMNDAKRMAFDSSDAIVASLGKITNALGKMKFDNFAQMGKSMATFGGIAAGVGVGVAAAVLKMSQSVASNMEQMNKLSQSYGLSLAQISQLRVAAGLTHVSLEEMTAGMGKLAKNAALVAESGQSTGGAFEKIGVRVTDAQGKLLPLNDLLAEVSEKFAKMPDGTTKTAMAMQLFGKAGAALIPWLNQGKEGIREYTEMAQKLGLVWDDKSAAAAARFNEQLDIQELRMTALKEQIAMGALPSLAKLAEQYATVGKDGNSLAKSLGEGVGKGLLYVGAIIDSVISSFKILSIEIKGATEDTADFLGSIKNAALHPTQAADIMREYTERGRGRQQQNKIDTERINNEWKNRYEELQKAFTFKTMEPRGKGENTPPLGTSAADMVAAGKQYDSLMDKVRNLSRTEKDPIQKQIEELGQLRNDLRLFSAGYEGTWGGINKAIQQVDSAIEHLRFKQREALNELMNAGTAKGIADLAQTPGATPTATGAVQYQASLIKLQQDAQARNQAGLSIYEQTRTASEKFADTLQKLNLLYSEHNITLEEYNRAKLQEFEAISASYDPQIRYNEALSRYLDIARAGLLTDTARIQMQRELNSLKNQAAAQTGGVGSGIGAGLSQYKLQMPTIGEEAMGQTMGALSRMQEAFSNFFSEIARGTKTAGQMFLELGQSMVFAIFDACAQMLARWVLTHTIMKAVSAMFHTADAAVTASAQGTKVAATIASNVPMAISNAGLAASAAFASAMEALPFPANVATAPAMAAMALGQGMAYVGMASAAGGMEVDRDQIIQVHKNEKVLPSRISAGFDRIINSFNPASAQSAPALSSTGGRQMPALNMPININGGTHDPNEIARKVSDVVMTRVKTHFRTNGVIGRG